MTVSFVQVKQESDSESDSDSEIVVKKRPRPSKSKFSFKTTNVLKAPRGKIYDTDKVPKNSDWFASMANSERITTEDEREEATRKQKRALSPPPPIESPVRRRRHHHSRSHRKHRRDRSKVADDDDEFDEDELNRMIEKMETMNSDDDDDDDDVSEEDIHAPFNENLRRNVLTDEEEKALRDKEMHGYLADLEMFRKMGYQTSRPYNFKSLHSDVKEERDYIATLAQRKRKIEFSRASLVTGIYGLEKANSNFNPYDLPRIDNWSETVYIEGEQGKYDDVLLKVYEKYGGSIEETLESQPLFLLGGMLAMSAFSQHKMNVRQDELRKAASQPPPVQRPPAYPHHIPTQTQPPPPPPPRQLPTKLDEPLRTSVRDNSNRPSSFLPPPHVIKSGLVSARGGEIILPSSDLDSLSLKDIQSNVQHNQQPIEPFVLSDDEDDEVAKIARAYAEADKTLSSVNTLSHSVSSTPDISKIKLTSSATSLTREPQLNISTSSLSKKGSKEPVKIVEI